MDYGEYEPDLTDVITMARQQFAPRGEPPVSLRALSRITGIPYSTLQGIATGRTLNPREGTIERLRRTMGEQLVTSRDRQLTRIVESPIFTPGTLDALQHPPGGGGVAFVFSTRRTPGGLATSDYFPPGTNVLQAARLAGLTPGMIRSVIFDLGRRNV